jgi:hypothetical protein
MSRTLTSTRLTQRMKEVRAEAMKDSTLYFLTILGSVLDDQQKQGTISGDCKREIYGTLKDYAIQRGYITQ